MNRKKFIISNLLLIAGVNIKLQALPFQRKEKDSQESFGIDFIGNSTEFLIYKKIVENIPGIVLHKIQNDSAISSNAKAVILSKSDLNIVVISESVLKQGKHVLLNLPGDCSFKDFSAMQLQANLQNLRIGINSPYRYLGAVIIARKYLYLNTLGIIKNYEILMSQDACLQESGYIGFGCHLSNLIVWLTGDSPSSITAKSDSIQSIQSPNTKLSFTAELKKGTIKYRVENRDNKSEWQLNIIGDKGSVEMHSDNTTIYNDSAGKKQTVFKGKAEDVNNAKRILLTDFVASCKNGKEPEVNSTEALQSILLNQGALKSVSLGKTVQLIEKSYPENNEQFIMNL